MAMPGHSPAPWKTVDKEHSGTMSKYTDIEDAKGISVFDVCNPCREEGSYIDCKREDLRHIVRCVNLHDELAKTLRKIRRMFKTDPQDRKHDTFDGCADEATEILDSLLAKINGE